MRYGDWRELFAVSRGSAREINAGCLECSAAGLRNSLASVGKQNDGHGTDGGRAVIEKLIRGMVRAEKFKVEGWGIMAPECGDKMSRVNGEGIGLEDWLRSRGFSWGL